MKLYGSGQSMSSDEWLALAGMLFGVLATVHGEEVYHRTESRPNRYGCMHCSRSFTSLMTPTLCPHCGQAPDERGILLTHRGHSGRTFAFAVEDA